MNTTTSSRMMNITALPIAPPIMVAETPVSEAPVAETPVVETPVVETPVEETPVEEVPEALDSVERAVELVGIPV